MLQPLSGVALVSDIIYSRYGNSYNNIIRLKWNKDGTLDEYKMKN